MLLQKLLLVNIDAMLFFRMYNTSPTRDADLQQLLILTDHSA